MAQGKKRKTAKLWFLYVVYCLIALVVVSEIVLRVAWTPPSFQTVIQGNDPVYHHSNRSDVELAKLDGWRRPILPRSDSSELRVFLVGDSFAQGMVDKAEQSISHMIEKELNEGAPSRKSVVYNMALLSYSPIVNYLVVRNLVLPNDPDVVLMMVDSSDPADDAIYELLAKTGPDGRPVAVRPPPDYDLLPLKLEMVWIVLNRYAANDWVWETYEQKRENRIAHYRDPYEQWEGAFKRTNRYIAMTAELCREKGVPFLLVHPPYPVVLKDRAPFAKWMEKWGFDASKEYRGANMDRALSQFAREHGVPFLNLEPTVLWLEKEHLAKGGRSSDLYQVDNGHFSELGHRLVAIPIASFVLENLPNQAKAKP